MTVGMTVVAAIDIGGTKTAAALVRGGEVLARAQAPTPAADGPGAVLDAAAALVAGLGGVPERFGAGIPGFVDPDTGLVRAATTSLAGWDGADVRGGLAARLGLAGAICNDVHAFVLGEAAYGAAAGIRDVVGVALGTGIGGGVIAGGELLVGAHGAGGHLGHVAVPQAAGLPCPCGASGHLEAVASGPGIAAGYARRSRPESGSRSGHARRGSGSGVRGVPAGPAPASALPEVVERYRAGDAAAGEALRVAGEALGTALGGLVNAFDPEVVVIGGGAALPEVLAAAQDTLDAAVMDVLRGIPVKPAGLGPDAPLLGAAGLAVTA